MNSLNLRLTNMIEVRYLTGGAPETKLGVGEKMPEEGHRSIFKEMFVNLGLPPEKVDKFEFNYVPSAW